MAVVREKYWSGQSLTGRTGDYGLGRYYGGREGHPEPGPE